MIHTKIIRITHQLAFLAPIVLFCISDASGLNVDSFCINSCKSPGLCSTEANIKSQCKKLCSGEHIWKQAAKLQMSSSKEFHMEKDTNKKDSMLYSSPLAKCLELKPNKEELAPKKEEPTQPPPPVPSPPSPIVPAPMKVSAPKEDLCAAAVKKAMTDLENERTTLGHDKSILESQKQELAAALKAHEMASAALGD